MKDKKPSLLRTLDTSLAIVGEREDGLLEMRFKTEDYIIDLDFIQETWEVFNELDPVDKALLVVAGKYGNITKEAREVEMFPTDSYNAFKAIAIVVPSIHKRLLGNLFFALRRKKPDFPYKMFPTEIDAMTWLAQFKA